MYKLLIADDESIERKALRNIIGSQYPTTIEVIEAVNGIDLLAKFDCFKPDIIFCDIKMPGKSGLEAMREIKAKNPDQIAVFLSAYDYFDYAREAVSLGVKEYLIKPAADNYVIDLVQKLIDILDKKKLQEQELSAQMEKLAMLDTYFQNTFKTEQNSEQYNLYEQHGELSARLEKLLKTASNIMEREYMYPLNLESIAKRVKLSSFYFSKMFKLYWKKSFTDYLAEIRIRESCKMLADPSFSIKEIAAAVGFSNSNYFSRVFKQIKNITPVKYRNKILN
ncbi:response regulator [Treponema sp. OMZ 840]|uniref:response regulator transcription factor n=1 Tax=Treponema sp. OMZ 840 TaxID=244313 RepID=UPI003D8B6D52